MKRRLLTKTLFSLALLLMTAIVAKAQEAYAVLS